MNCLPGAHGFDMYRNNVPLLYGGETLKRALLFPASEPFRQASKTVLQSQTRANACFFAYGRGVARKF